MGRKRILLRRAKQRFKDNQQRAARYGYPWKITFEDWYAWWLKQGVDKDAPGQAYSRDSLMMARIDESKPYTIDNVIAMTRGATQSGRPSFTLGKQRPHTWIIKDPELHRMYIPFLKAKAQTDYRVRHGKAEGEWLLSFDDFVAVWGDFWDLRGKGSYDYALTRIDPEKDWTRANVEVLTRKEQLSRAQEWKNARRG